MKEVEAPIIALVGPTGVGKSHLAMRLAETVGGEVLSADSRQVYRYLDIGTAKPTPEEQSSVPHHLIDLVTPDQRYSVVDFCRDAESAHEAISRRSGTSYLVGGTGYYVRAFLQRANFPGNIDGDDDLRQPEREIRETGSAAAIAEIRQIDPESAERLERDGNPRRIARTLRIIKSTGRPVPKPKTSPRPALVIGLHQDRKRLYERLDRRVDTQIALGLPEETAGILARGYSAELPVLTGLAYGQMVKYLRGDWTMEQAATAYKYATHALVRRQMTWFRKEPGVRWFDVDAANFEIAVEEEIRRWIDSRRDNSPRPSS